MCEWRTLLRGGGGTRGDGVFVSVQGFAFLTATVDPANGNNERICAATKIHFADLTSRKPSLCAGSTNRQKMLGTPNARLRCFGFGFFVTCVTKGGEELSEISYSLLWVTCTSSARLVRGDAPIASRVGLWHLRGLHFSSP